MNLAIIYSKQIIVLFLKKLCYFLTLFEIRGTSNKALGLPDILAFHWL